MQASLDIYNQPNRFKTNEDTRILDSKNLKQGVIELKGHSGYVNGMVFNSDNRQVLSCSSDKTLRLWDIGSGKNLRVMKDHTDTVLSVAFSNDGRQALSGSSDRTVRLWDIESGKILE